LDDVENDLKKMGVRGRRKIARARYARKLILKGARALHGRKSNWRREMSVKGQLEICRNKRSCLVLGNFRSFGLKD
jgi:hypothetical protein